MALTLSEIKKITFGGRRTNSILKVGRFAAEDSFFLRKDIASKTLTIAAASSSGSTAADPAWVGATVIGCVPVSGNDKVVASVSVAADGAVTVTTAGNETAEATFRVTALLA